MKKQTEFLFPADLSEDIASLLAFGLQEKLRAGGNASRNDKRIHDCISHFLGVRPTFGIVTKRELIKDIIVIE